MQERRKSLTPAERCIGRTLEIQHSMPYDAATARAPVGVSNDTGRVAATVSDPHGRILGGAR